MAIVPLDRITLYGAAGQEDEAIRSLQELGCVHLVNLGSEQLEAEADVAERDRAALAYLKSCGQQLQPARRAQGFDRQAVVDEALEIQRGERERIDESAELRKAIADLEPWGEFRLPPADRFGGLQWWFYVIPLHQAEELVGTDFVYQEAARDHRNAYVVVLSREEPEAVPGRLVRLDERPLSVLKDRLIEVDEQLEELRHRRVGLTRWCDLLAQALDQADDAAARRHAAQMTYDQRGVFAISGWAPRTAVERIQQFAKKSGLAVAIEPPADDDQPPTLLHNPEALAGSETLVTFYKTPKYGSWDPSLVAFFSFAVFFAMILADAGYALALGVIALRYWGKMGQTAAGRRGRNVLATVVVFSIAYGVMCGSYFGITPPPDSLLGRMQILDAQSQAMMMPLSILIGVVHLSIAHLVMAWLRRRQASALSSLGWVAVMAGGIVAGVAISGGLAEETAGGLTRVGLWLLVGGLASVFLFSSERPLFSLSPKNHVLRILDGFKGVTDLSSLFGDVLSYLRLFALGLSSAKLAQTFNALAQDAWDSAGFGVILAIAIALIGHALNLALSLMSGVVHGLRLNCIEFLKWSSPDEGYSFTAFAKKAR